ncbi:Cell wall-associated hydrolase, NlpC family [[Eubacterium] yurii]|nr:Cell wall-associated hydrolase, NlpC family [[Eubacterium] yurii]
MKYFKYFTAVAFVALFTNFSYADDISGMIFQGNEIDEALIVNSTVTLTKQTKSTNNIQKTKSEREIDLFIEKAKNDAAKKEEEKLRQEKLKKEEEKLAEEKRKERQREEEEKAQREKERERELERRKEEEEKAQKEQTTPKEPQVQDVSQKAPAQTLLASGITVDSNEVTNFSKTLLGVPYVWGGTSLEGFDCSGFVQYVYKKYEMDLSRTTYTQIKQGKSIALSDIKENDLVFFDTRASSMLTKAKSQGVSGTLDTIIINESDTGNSKKLYPSEPTHVGMYIGNGKMIHASSSKKQVVVEVLENDYFKDRIVDIRRYK